MQRQHAFQILGLYFANEDIEEAFRQYHRHQLTAQARLVLPIGIVIYLGTLLVDVASAPEARSLFLFYRTVFVVLSLLILVFLWRVAAFARYLQPALFLTFFMLAPATLHTYSVMDASLRDSYYAGYILIMMFSLFFVGLRFELSLALGAWQVAAFGFASGYIQQPASALFPLQFNYVLAASAQALVACYLYERQRRNLFFERYAEAVSRKHHEERAVKDSLTGVFNRILLDNKLATALERSRMTREAGALLFIDLDGFKSINDTLGHHIGDLVLKEMSARLLGAARQEDLVFRVGGDEFVVLVQGLSDPRDVKEIVNRFRLLLSENIVLHPRNGKPHELMVMASIGAATFDGTTDFDADHLFNAADLAMYKDKKTHKIQMKA